MSDSKLDTFVPVSRELVLSGILPWAGLRYEDAVQRLLKKHPLDERIMLACWQADPHARPTFTDLVRYLYPSALEEHAAVASAEAPARLAGSRAMRPRAIRQMLRRFLMDRGTSGTEVPQKPKFQGTRVPDAPRRHGGVTGKFLSHHCRTSFQAGEARQALTPPRRTALLLAHRPPGLRSPCPYDRVVAKPPLSRSLNLGTRPPCGGRFRSFQHQLSCESVRRRLRWRELPYGTRLRDGFLET